MKKIISTGLIIATSFLAGCGVNNNINAEDVLIFSRVDKDGYFNVYKDEKTGVHYIKYSHANGVGLCPRYNADGNLYVD